MKITDVVPIKQSVSTKLFRTVFPLYLLIAIVVTLVHLLIEFNNTNKHIREELVSVGNAISPGLKTALWSVNYKQLKSIVEGVQRLPVVTGMQIENERGELVGGFGAGGVSGSPRSDKESETLSSFDEDFRYSIPLIYEKNGHDIPVGKLTLHSSWGVVYQRLKLGIYLIVLNALIKSVALLILFVFFARIIISKPLQELTMLINNTQMDNLRRGHSQELNSSENNELVLLKKAFNAMLEKLSEAHGQLLSHSDELEKKVDERTRELANREEKLKIAYDQLQQSRNAELKTLNDKRQFMADVSHELRTPISVMKLQLEALQQGVSSNEDSQKLLQRKIDQMERLIDDLSVLSKADIEQLSLKCEEFEICLLLQELIEPFRHLAGKRNIELRLRYVDDCNPCVYADWERLSQVFSNLLDNSLNYTNSGGLISISVKALGQEVEVIIEDSAPGVSDENLPLLTQRLFRGESSRSRNTGGSGLGLAICESLIRAHGGSITLHHSELGGLKVIIVLPIVKLSGRYYDQGLDR